MKKTAIDSLSAKLREYVPPPCTQADRDFTFQMREELPERLHLTYQKVLERRANHHPINGYSAAILQSQALEVV